MAFFISFFDQKSGISLRIYPFLSAPKTTTYNLSTPKHRGYTKLIKQDLTNHTCVYEIYIYYLSMYSLT